MNIHNSFKKQSAGGSSHPLRRGAQVTNVPDKDANRQEEIQHQVHYLEAIAGATPVLQLNSPAVSRLSRIVLRRKQVRVKLGIGNTMFHRVQNPRDTLFDKDFPASFSILGGRARGYFEDEIDAWLERRAAQDPRRKNVIDAEICASRGVLIDGVGSGPNTADQLTPISSIAAKSKVRKAGGGK